MNPAFQSFLVFLNWAFELLKWIIILVVIGVIIHFFVATIFIVEGASMEPNLHTGQFVLTQKTSFIFGTPKRGQIVVLRYPGDPERKKYIKRIIGLPGETVTISEGAVYINGQQLRETYLAPYTQTLPDLSQKLNSGEYFTMGDNRENSNDSRIWGVCPKENLVGAGWLILYPFREIGFVPQAAY